MNRNERGFILLSAVFLTLILSFVAAMTLQTLTQSKNSDAALRLHAINLANEQFAMIESLAAQGDLTAGQYNFLGDADDLKSYGLIKKSAEKIPVEFEVKTKVSGEGNLRKVEILVAWKNFEMNFEKTVRIGDVEE